MTVRIKSETKVVDFYLDHVFSYFEIVQCMSAEIFTTKSMISEKIYQK
jgi:hypothetical protein